MVYNCTWNVGTIAALLSKHTAVGWISFASACQRSSLLVLANRFGVPCHGPSERAEVISKSFAERLIEKNVVVSDGAAEPSTYFYSLVSPSAFPPSAEPIRAVVGQAASTSAYSVNRPSRPHCYGDQTRGCLRFMTIDNRHLGLHAARCIQYQSQGFDCYSALQWPARPDQSQAVPLVRTAASCVY